MDRQIDVREADLHEVREGGEGPEVFVFEATPKQRHPDAERAAELLTVQRRIAADHQCMVTVGELDRSFHFAPEDRREPLAVHGREKEDLLHVRTPD